MTERFEHYLNSAKKIREIDSMDHYSRRSEVSTYYYNKSSDLKAGALVIWHAFHEYNSVNFPNILGLERGHDFRASLPQVFYMLCGQSIELLIKSITKILERPFESIYNLRKLLLNVGINFSDDRLAILDALTECVYWAGRYPVAKSRDEDRRANEIFSSLWEPTDNGSKAFPIKRINPQRSLNRENFLGIWDQLDSKYWMAKKVISEP